VHLTAIPNFKIFFSRLWNDTLYHSLINFLSSIFNSSELPKILNFNVERKERLSLKNEIDRLTQENNRLRNQMEYFNTKFGNKDNQNIVENTSSNTSNIKKRGTYS